MAGTRLTLSTVGIIGLCHSTVVKKFGEVLFKHVIEQPKSITRSVHGKYMEYYYRDGGLYVIASNARAKEVKM